VVTPLVEWVAKYGFRLILSDTGHLLKVSPQVSLHFGMTHTDLIANLQLHNACKISLYLTG
jgi:hypothetical protein